MEGVPHGVDDFDKMMLSPERIPALEGEWEKQKEAIRQRTEVIVALSGLADNPEAAEIVEKFGRWNAASEERIEGYKTDIEMVKTHNSL